MMFHGTYIGPVGHLKGKTALLQLLPPENLQNGGPMHAVFLSQPPLYLKAQFDDIDLMCNGVCMGFHWHQFLRRDWKIDPPVNWKKDEEA